MILVQTNPDVGDFFPENYHDELESVIPRCSQNVVVQETQKVPLDSLTRPAATPDPALPGKTRFLYSDADLRSILCTLTSLKIISFSVYIL